MGSACSKRSKGIDPLAVSPGVSVAPLPPQNFYAVWVIPGQAGVAGVWYGDARLTWAALAQHLPLRRYIPGRGVHLRRLYSLDEAVSAYRAEAARHQVAFEPVLHHVD